MNGLQELIGRLFKGGGAYIKRATEISRSLFCYMDMVFQNRKLR